ncbi:MAG: XisI protein [Saprospiraceae bacterium]
MDNKLIKYEQIIIDTLREYAAMYNQQRDGLEAKVIIDREERHYQLLNCGWRKDEYQFYVIFHFDIKDGKVWVQENRTDVLIAQQLVEKGILKSDIVLGLQFPELRSESGYAAA